MIADLRPYAEYKDSGSKWLGAVPAKWEVRNLRTLISKRAERDRADLPLLSVAREKGAFVRSLTDADENHNVIPEDLSNYKVARAGIARCVAERRPPKYKVDWPALVRAYAA